MPTQLPTKPSSMSASIATPQVLTSRQQYLTCHLHLPDMPQKFPGILFAGQYYSFFKAFPTLQKTVQVSESLQRKDEVVVITQTPKGYVLWVMEPDAYQQPAQYPICKIRVPDLEEEVAAIVVDNRYYSLFQEVPDSQQRDRILAILEQRGDRSIITRTRGGYSIWVLEPVARLIAA